ncbi:MAG: LamG domain-containing protein [Phycisphaerales bacterium]
MARSCVAVGACALALAVVHRADPATGPVAHWKFDEGRGAIANDSSGYGNTGTIFGGATWTRGVAGAAIRLDGIDDYVNCGNGAVLNPALEMSISAWFRGTQAFSGSGNDAIVDKGYVSHRPPYYQYHLGVTGTLYPNDAGAAQFTTSGAVGAGTQANAWVVGQWYHFVATTGASGTNFYVDGELIQHNPNAPAPMTDFGKPLLIGKFANLPFYLPCDIDDVQVYDRSLSCAEVQFLFSNPGLETTSGGAAVFADLDADGHVSASDLAIMLGAWGDCAACPSDLDCSGTVDANDLAILLGAWTG